MPLPSLPARALVLLVALALTGCAGLRSSTQIVAPDRLDIAAAEVAGGSGLLSLADGTRYRVESLRIDPDTTSWIDPVTGALRLVATPSVAQFEARDRRQALFRGAGLGALAGAAVGAALGLSVCADFGCDDAATAVVGVGTVGAAAGAFWGGVLGAATDPVDRWMFERPARRAPAEPAAPGPTGGG